jgi:hypothetical protein
MFIGVAAVAVACGLVGVRAQEPQGPREGITVHGHWVIDIKNPDGSPALHREFENALLPSGIFAMNGLLTKLFAVDSWSLKLSSTTTSPCGNSGNLPAVCTIGEALNITATSTNLVVSANESAPPTLTGSFQAPEAGVLDRVESHVATCGAAAGSCRLRGFSGTNISPLTIAKDQIVQVSVRFFFS